MSEIGPAENLNRNPMGYREARSNVPDRELQVRTRSTEVLRLTLEAIMRDYGLAVELGNRTRLPSWLVRDVAKYLLANPHKAVL